MNLAKIFGGWLIFLNTVGFSALIVYLTFNSKSGMAWTSLNQINKQNCNNLSGYTVEAFSSKTMIKTKNTNDCNNTFVFTSSIHFLHYHLKRNKRTDVSIMVCALKNIYK